MRFESFLKRLFQSEIQYDTVGTSKIVYFYGNYINLIYTSIFTHSDNFNYLYLPVYFIICAFYFRYYFKKEIQKKSAKYHNKFKPWKYEKIADSILMTLFCIEAYARSRQNKSDGLSLFYTTFYFISSCNINEKMPPILAKPIGQKSQNRSCRFCLIKL